MQIIQNYLKQISDISYEDKEHTHRSALENLINNIKIYLSQKSKYYDKITIKQEPNNDKGGLGAPDFMVMHLGLVIGYIENKKISINLDNLVEAANTDSNHQINRYLKLNPNLILCDYLNFYKIKKHNNKIIISKKIKICDFKDIKKTPSKSTQDELIQFFKDFFDTEGKSIVSALEFADALAIRTKELKNALEILKDDGKINGLYESFKEVLYKEISFSDFADNFAQTLTYALFLAKLNNTNNDKIDLYNAKKFIPRSFPLIRSMSGFLEHLDEVKDQSALYWLIEEILNIINHIDINSIIKELNKQSTNTMHKDPYLHFYESFLYKYDPALRKLRGVYYTPFAVVDFIINAIDRVLKDKFDFIDGLGSAMDHNITLLDFATGTGTFLLEAFRKALNNIPQNSPYYKPKELLNKFSGFEFLIAPYTIAHLKISQSFKEEFSSPLNDDEKINILLTNTLYNKPYSPDAQKSGAIGLFATQNELNAEFTQALKVKNQNILIITGNPPYSGASANNGLFENELKEAYYKEPGTNQRLKNEKSIKWLLDDYVKFIRFAEAKIAQQNSGIIAIISNNAYIDNPTFRGMRYSLLKSFDEIYILDLHGNTRKKEKSPDGSKDENVFDIMQGVCISIFIKLNDNDNLAKIYHSDIYGKRKDKYNILLENDIKSIKWRNFIPKPPFYAFVPCDNEGLRELYDGGGY